MPSMDQVTSDPMGPEAAAPPAAPTEPAAPEDSTKSAQAELPEAVLKIPAISALLAGSPPATYAAENSKSPELKVLEKNIDPLTKAGFGLYRTKDKSNFVLFNNLILSPEEVKKADAEGKLDSIAAPFEDLNASMSEGFKGSESDGEAFATPAPPAGQPPSAAAQKKTQNQRLKNVQPGGPTDGPQPGAGRVLNNILKPVV